MQGVKHVIWDALISEATKLRSYLDYILDKEISMQSSKQSVATVRERLNKNPIDYARNAIHFPNRLKEEEIRTTNLMDRISIITWARKVVNRHHHLDTIESNIGIMAHEVKSFIEMFNPLVKMGLPFF